tara:strand:- start:1783 stop:3156 length:1374 start_codon:yes stop_codon:yes gene_type:complete
VKDLIPLSAIQKRMAQDMPVGKDDESTARRIWWAALDTLQEDILLPMNVQEGIWLSSPLPVLYEPKLLQNLEGWVWAPNELASLHTLQSGRLLPSDATQIDIKDSICNTYRRLSLKEEDGYDPLLIIISRQIQIALTLHGPPMKRSLILRSDANTLKDITKMLLQRLSKEESLQSNQLQKDLSNFKHIYHENNIEQNFWPLLSSRLANMAPTINLQPLPNKRSSKDSNDDINGEISLLEAITHEVRTPLATIRTLIRSLLKRNDLNSLVTKRLREIDSECTEQIDRFGLIFNAAELQRQEPNTSRLASTDLGNMLRMLEPAWIDVLQRRGITLKIDISPDLPKVLSDPERLEMMLGGLIDRSTRGLQPGETLGLELRPAGQKLKLQILKKSQNTKQLINNAIKQNSDLGAVLSWNPSTGSLQLSQAATQKLLASLGGKMTLRRDSVLTIFFPIADNQ